MDGPEKPLDGPHGDGLSITPQERETILRRAYPARYGHHRVRAIARGATAVLGAGIVGLLGPLILLLHAGLRLLGRNGIAHTSPAGHGLVLTANVHAFKRANHGPCKHS